jgi:cytochrome c oxidase subunit 3/cytochrome o ubiquinol oxidase subunit 3
MSEPMSDLRGRVGMCCLIAAESAIFTIFVVAYLFYLGKSVAGPAPADVLHAPIVLTICLLSSSLTIHAGVTALRKGNVAGFARWWLVTLALGAVFLAGTALEWYRLIYVEGLTIQTNLFGTTYFSLVGLHAFHVTAGLAGLTLGSTLALLGYVTPLHVSRTDVFSLYWHFVDAVWVVVFLVVYVAGR